MSQSVGRFPEYRSAARAGCDPDNEGLRALPREHHPAESVGKCGGIACTVKIEPEQITIKRYVLEDVRLTPLAIEPDVYLVVGDEIIETPTCWRSRHFEGDAYRKLFKEYFANGARWTAAPRPQLPDELYDAGYRVPEPEETIRYIINEFEPVFDAADIARCGRDLFVTRSNATNQVGIDWLRRHLGAQGLRIHELESRCRQPMHIDTTFVPLAPGKVLVNPDFIDVDRLPPILKRWDVLIAPRPDPVDDLMAKFSMCSPWTSINVLMLDHRHVVVDAAQSTLHRALKDWGFEPVPLPFVAYGPFGGSFHCATLDTRRRGALEDYF